MFSELVKIISSDSGLAEEEVINKISEKQRELAGLISEEGAAYIVAKELGLSLLRRRERLSILNIIPGMKNIDIIGKVVRIFPVKEFQTEKASGRVMNLILADNTGSVRLSLWNDEIERIEGIVEGDVIHIQGYAREDNTGSPELRLGRFGLLQKSEESVEPIATIERNAERGTIADLKEGHYRTLKACMLQAFESNIFYEICPQCGARMKDVSCPEHGELEPDFGLVIAGVIDDGTDSIRIVLFRENAEKIIGMDRKEAKALFDRKKSVRAVTENIQFGKDYVFEGRVRKNEVFDRLEFVASAVKDVDVKREIKILLEGN